MTSAFTFGLFRQDMAASVSTERVHSGTQSGKMYLTGFDVINRHQFSWHTYLYRKTPDVSALKEGLARALLQMPAFSGQIRKEYGGSLYIDCADYGVPITVEDVPYSIPSYGVHHSVDLDFKKYVPACPLSIVDKNEALFRVKITRFRCGACIVGAAWPHSLVDGTAYMEFVTRWAKYARGDSTLPDPELDRSKFSRLAKGSGDSASAISSMVNLGRFEFFSFMLRALFRSRFFTDHYAFVLTVDQIDNIRKQRASLGLGNFSTGDLLSAIMWKKIAEIQNLSEFSTLGTIRNVRGVPGVDLPDDYIGNAFMLSLVGHDFRGDAKNAIFEIASAIRDDKKKFTADMVREELAYLTKVMKKGKINLTALGVVNAQKKGALCNNLSRFPVRELDFGSGMPFWLDGPSRRMALRYFSLFPSVDREGDLVVHLILPSKEMRKFKKNHGGSNAVLDGFLSLV